MLNPNRKSHIEVVSKTCDQILNMIDVENQLKTSFESNKRLRIEQMDKFIAHVFQKARKKVERLIHRKKKEN